MSSIQLDAFFAALEEQRKENKGFQFKPKPLQEQRKEDKKGKLHIKMMCSIINFFSLKGDPE